MGRKEEVIRIYKTLGKELSERVKQDLYQTVRDQIDMPKQIENILIEKNKGQQRVAYFKCPDCDGLKNLIKDLEEEVTYLRDPQTGYVDSLIFEYCYEMFELDCPKCEGTGIVDWAKYPTK